jgi:YD repeat-containing protein
VSGIQVVDTVLTSSISDINFGLSKSISDNQPPNYRVGFSIENIDVGTQLSYRPPAFDPDGDILSYDLVIKPDGMVVDSATGLIVWMPSQSQIGQHTAIVRAQDGKGGVDLHEFQVNVKSSNRSPIFTSLQPVINPRVGQEFQFQAKTIDPDGDTVRYEISRNSAQSTTPSNVTIDAVTGLLKWTPSPAQLGGVASTSNGTNSVEPWDVLIRAYDSKGGEVFQLLKLIVDSAPTIGSNNAPVITSTPRTSVATNRPYIYAIEASDSDGDSLAYELLPGAPAGLSLTGKIITWTPTAAQFGSQSFQVKVSDNRGGFVTQTVPLSVTNQITNNAPIIIDSPTLKRIPDLSGTAGTLQTEIDSQPRLAVVDHVYAYNFKGLDPDGDVAAWVLLQAPTGMVIDSETGALRWQPNAGQIGGDGYDVIVALTDVNGASDTVAFKLIVNGSNLPPQITSTPSTSIAIGQPYRYAVQAKDPENGILSYGLAAAPVGMKIDSKTGVITWDPAVLQIGNHNISVAVTDELGSVVTQAYTLKVLSANDPQGNRAPVISSNPVFLADPTKSYSYQVVAADPDAGAILTYTLLKSPVGMAINASTGLITWDNPLVTSQPHEVIVKVVDQFGLGVGQGYSLMVRANSAPVISSTAPQSVTLGGTYRYDVRATDAEGDALTYSLNNAAIARGVRIDGLGRIFWTPQASDLSNPLPVTVTVKDAQGAIVSQSFDVGITADTQAPQVLLKATRNFLNVGESITFEAKATDNVGVAGLKLVVNGQAVVLDGQGRTTLTFNSVQTINALATAVDAAGNSSNSAPLVVDVIDPTGAFDPVFGINGSLLPSDYITAPTPVFGSVGGTGFARYELAIAPLDSENFTVIARGSGAIANGKLGTIDPSLLQNDTYTLRLLVYGSNGSVTYVDETVDVVGELKLGNFRLSFTDVAIPVTGIPISLTRTYDTLTSGASDDFGYGWRMEFRDTDLRTSLRKRSEEEELLGRYPSFDDRTKVYITLPGGKRETFSFKAKPVEQIDGTSLGLFTKYFYEPTFKAENGSTNKLTVESSFFTRGADGKYYGLQGNPFNPADGVFGGVYVLTTKEGVKYRINAGTGDLLTITDTNGNTLTYSDEGVLSSTGVKITFERDAQGRIVSVKDPENEYVRYGYDAQGDLVSVMDRESNTTRMVYDTSYDDPSYPGTQDVGRTKRAHFLREIVDPLGRIGARTEYDESGRLKQIVNVDGQAVDMSYDLANDRQVVKDQLGNETVYIYDNRGNILTEIDAVGKITKRKYDSNNNALEETVISDRSGSSGFTTRYTYDSQNNKLTETNALGETMYYSYDSQARLLSETDAMGRTTKNRYDSQGNLVESLDAQGQASGYGYTPTKGLLRSMKDAKGQETFFSYDIRGNVSQVQDAEGNITDYSYNRKGEKITETIYRKKADGTTESIQTRWSYDSEGRMLSMTDALGKTTSYGYDALGRQVSITDALGRTSRSIYNPKGELVEAIQPDGTPNDPSDNPHLRMVYDAAGRKVAQIDQLGRETRYVYDKVGRLLETIHPDATVNDWGDNARVRTEYYTDGLVKAQIDERGNRTEFRYDNLGRQVAVIAADSTPNDLGDNPTTRYVYDKAGQQTSVIDALGQVTAYEYDGLGRMVKTIYADKTFSSQEYDQLGRRVAAIDQNGKRTEYRYDDMGRLTGVKDALGQLTEYGYNEQGQLIYQEDANDHRTTYEYDQLGRRIATILPLTQRSGMTYDEVGNSKTMTDFNGQTVRYLYDEQNRLTEKQFQDGSKVQYGYLKNGLQDTVTFRNGTGVVTSFYDYDYDLRDRLTQRTDILGSGSSQTNRTIGYGYDVASNRTSVTTASGTTTYPTFRRLPKQLIIV